MTTPVSQSNPQFDGKSECRCCPKLGVAIALLLSMAGMAVSVILLQHHLAVAIGGNPLFSGVCEMSEHSSCDAVLRSAYATFWNRPTALWGFFYFACMFAWYLVVGLPAYAWRRWQLLPILVSAAATGICAGLAFVMYTRLPQWCPFCAATHLICALLFIVSALLWPRQRTASPGTPSTSETTVALAETATCSPAPRPCKQVCIAILLAVAISLAGSADYYRRLNKAAAADYRQRWELYENDLQMVYNRFMSEPVVNIPIDSSDSVIGSPNAKHTAILFGDFQCEFCRGTDKIIREKLAAYPDDLRVVFKHYPMNKECNPNVVGKLHPGACAAAVSAEAARKLGGDDAFWKMHDELFAHQGEFARKAQQFLHDTCPKLGIDEKRMWQTIQTSSVWSRVSQHVAQAHAVGVTAVPAVYLDGRKMNAWALSRFWDFILTMGKEKTKSPGRNRTPETSRPAPVAPSNPTTHP